MGAPTTNLPENNQEEPVQTPTEFKKLTGEEIISVLNNKSSISEFGCDELDSKELGLGELKEVMDERTGSDFDCKVKVGHFVDHDVYIQVTGYYSSGNGTEWDGDFEEVRPVEKTVIEYETIKK